MIAGGAEHGDSGVRWQEPFDDHVFATDIEDAAQPIALVLEHRPLAESVDAHPADWYGRLGLHLQQLAREQEGVAVQLPPGFVMEGVAPALKDRLADAQIVDARRHLPGEQQWQRA